MSRVNLLGVNVTAHDLGTVVSQMDAAIAGGRRTYACTCPVYTLMQGSEHTEVRSALNGADWVTADGMPVVWALRWFGAHRVDRVYGPDLLLALSALSAEKGYKQFYLGGGPGVAADLALEVARRFPGLQVAGTYSPPFRELTTAEEQEIVDRINQSQADVVWVGLGSPKQDLWLARFRPRLTAPLLIGVGAAFDFLTGRQRQAPLWLQRNGLEWLFRLAHEPRRLWKRYLFSNPRFVVEITRQRLRWRRS